VTTIPPGPRLPRLISIPGGIYLAGGAWAISKAVALGEQATGLVIVGAFSGLLYGLTVRAINDVTAGGGR
jgi:hypothetical protein